jgi:hypothetical protein
VPPGDMAVLFRTNAQSEAFEAALADRDIPYLVRGGERFFSRKEVRDAVLLMRGAARSDDGSKPLPEVVRDVLLGAGWTRQAPSSGGATRERWESLAALAALSDDLAVASPEARLPEFVRELDERAAAQHAPAVQGVTLASLHSAKGLEWDVVFLAGCSDGYLPIAMASTPDAIEEERRLAYVGVTRARRELRLSWAAARTPGARASRPEAGAAGPLPRVRHRADHGGPAQDRPLRRLPTDVLRGDVREAAGLATGGRPRGERAGIRGVHRRDPHRHRRARAGHRGRAGTDLRCGCAQAGPLRDTGARGPRRRGTLTASSRPICRNPLCLKQIRRLAARSPVRDKKSPKLRCSRQRASRSLYEHAPGGPQWVPPVPPRAAEGGLAR